MQKLTIAGHSTALFSTWIFVEEMRLLFDAGDGVMSTLMHKAARIKHVCMSHSDRDHVYGLMQLNHHAANHGLEAVFYPAEAGSFKAMRDFCWRFDAETRDAFPWIPVSHGDTFDLGRNLGLRVVYNSHIPVAGKSVGYIVERLFRKLKPEYAGLPQDELEKLGRSIGSEALTEPRREPLLGYSGDTGPCPIETWSGCKVLIHEATFLKPEDLESERAGYLHSTLPDVIEMAHGSGVEQLILSHFSSRYTKSEIIGAIQELCDRFEATMRVSALLPGETVRDLLARPPVWPRQS